MYQSHTMDYYAIIEEKEKRLYSETKLSSNCNISEKARHETVRLHLFYSKGKYYMLTYI